MSSSSENITTQSSGKSKQCTSSEVHSTEVHAPTEASLLTSEAGEACENTVKTVGDRSNGISETVMTSKVIEEMSNGGTDCVMPDATDADSGSSDVDSPAQPAASSSGEQPLSKNRLRKLRHRKAPGAALITPSQKV